MVLDLEFLSLDGLGWNDQALLGLACCILLGPMKVPENLKIEQKKIFRLSAQHRM